MREFDEELENAKPETLREMIQLFDDMEADVRRAAAMGSPFPDWAEKSPHRPMLKLYYHHQRDYVEPRSRGVAPF